MDSRPVALYQALSRDLAPFFGTPPVEVSEMDPPSSVRCFAANQMRDNFIKKYIQSSELADIEAKNVFLASNKKCKGWVSPYRRTDLSESDMLLVGQFYQIVQDFFLNDLGKDVECSWRNICEYARSGPGSSVGGRSGSFYAKHFSSPLTATSQSLIDVYKADIWLVPEFSNAEIIRQENYGSPSIVEGSRSSFVPKTLDISRMICVEPTVNMYLQLGLGEIILKRLKRYFGIDLETQPSVNRYLACLGSDDGRTFGQEANYATIDLKSASDSISLGLAGDCIPPEWLSAILELRSTRTQLGRDTVELNMVSTMGNGFTFPLQTALFSCIVAACYSLDDRSVMGRNPLRAATPENRMGEFSVFGDDIVVKTKYFHRVSRLLEVLGFTVNAAKSFASGGFRESCGHDYYHGYNVRAVYCRKVKTDQDISVLINLLLEWSTRTGISVHNTIELLWSWFRKKPLLVPFDENMDSGVRVPFALINDASLQKAHGIESDSNLSISYRRYISRAPRIRFGDGTVKVPRGHRSLIYNPSGLLMAFLRGEVRKGVIMVRENHGLPYDTKRAVTPYWDWQRPTIEARVFGLCFDKARWNTVATSHLNHLVRR